MGSKFVHLHVHTEYSLLDGLTNIKKLFSYIKDLGMESIAITDHGVMYGAIEFYKQGLREGIKPIIGMEAYISSVDHRERPERGKFKNYHLILLAKNSEGYKNLIQLTSEAHLRGFYYRPRVDHQTLAKYAKGLICTSACPQGEVAQAIISEGYGKAREVANWFLELFGEDYYLEVQRHKYESYIQENPDAEIRESLRKMSDDEQLINEQIVKLSRDLGVPLVATNDSHYIKKEDAPAQDALLCIVQGKNISDKKRLRYIDAPAFQITTQKEMEDLFPDLPESLENTTKIAAKCDLKIETFGKWFFPKFEVPRDSNPDDYLRRLARERLGDKIKNPNKEARDRLEHELKIITQKGYSTYFLILMDLVNWAEKQGIITNTRGSAAGSLVSYVLGITTVNPLTYYLPFERFLNPYRPTPPDIDLDVADDRREEILSYLVKKYGEDRVAQICTFGRMLSRAAVRDIARVLGYPYSVGDKVAKLIPPPKQGFPITISKALGTVEELKKIYETDVDARKILDLAAQIEGNARHVSVHAAGVVISPGPLTDFVPLQREPSGEKIISQYEMRACEDVGLIKIDILGIRNLSILGSSIDIVEKQIGKRIKISEIPLDDKKTFEMLGRGETMGIFQLSSAGMTKHLTELRPERVEDLMAMVALYRPGPMAVIPEYIRRKKNPKLVKYPDPRMEKFLKASYGLLVYQDDLLFSALELAGYTWEEADKFRKAVGKKIPEEMAAQKERFTRGIVENGQTKEFAEELWRLFEPFQSYGFNKAHAASYGIVAYQTAYMKANYPVEYMTALLTAEAKDADKVSQAISECRRMGIRVLPPDINESAEGFTIVKDRESLEGKSIRFGLDAIKNVGKAALEAIIDARSEGPFTSFADFVSRVDGRRVNKKVMESLIKVGAMTNLGPRASLLASIDSVRSKVAKFKAPDGQQGLFSEETPTKSMAVGVSEDAPEFSQEELQNFERDLLGFSLSAKPVSEIIAPYSHRVTHKINELIGDKENLPLSPIKIAAVVNEIRVVVTKKTGAEMAFTKISDGTGSVDLVIFPKLYQKVKDILIENTPILVTGRPDLRDDSPSILAEVIETEDTTTQTSANYRVFIKIPKKTNRDRLNALKSLLVSTPGNQSISLVFEEGHKVIDLPFKINWNERLAQLINEILAFDEEIQ